MGQHSLSPKNRTLLNYYYISVLNICNSQVAKQLDTKSSWLLPNNYHKGSKSETKQQPTTLLSMSLALASTASILWMQNHLAVALCWRSAIDHQHLLCHRWPCCGWKFITASCKIATPASCICESTCPVFQRRHKAYYLIIKSDFWEHTRILDFQIVQETSTRPVIWDYNLLGKMVCIQIKCWSVRSGNSN